MKILILDIETSPNLVYTWGLFNQFINIDFIVEPTYVMSWAAKWLGKKNIYYKQDGDVNFLEDIWEMIDSADAVVHYNGTTFDMKHLNREFVEAGMMPPLIPKNIDLLKTVKERFRFPSNKMDYVARTLLKRQKLEHNGIKLWVGCLMNNDPKWWNILKRYNKEDVRITELLYLKLRGWIKGHPNHGLYIEDQENPVCRACGSENVGTRGWQRLNVQSYMRYQCKDCGWQGRGRKRVQGNIKTAKQVTV